MRNPVDRIIELVSPERALRRHQARQALRILNTGYSEGGASTRKNAFKRWSWRGGDTRQDIETSLDILRQRSRDLYMNSGIARAPFGRMQTNVIGAGLRLRSVPDPEVLAISTEDARSLSRQIEREFAIWAESKASDQLGLNTFYENQGIALLSWLMGGDVLALLPMGVTPGQPYELRIHLIEADRLSTPSSKANDERFHSGVETDAEGRVVAYHVRNGHPLGKSSKEVKWQRIPAWGDESGRLNVLHMMVAERPEQYRGVPWLAPVIEGIKQITRYTEAELAAAVVAGMYTVFIKSDTPDHPLGEPYAPETELENTDPDSEYNYALGNGAIVGLSPGEDISTANPGRPNAQFNTFVDAVAQQIGAAVDIPVEQLLLKFNASYSASRAALLEAWKLYRIWRARMATNFCNPIYAEWFTEAVLKGRISAPGFLDDPAIRAAYLRCQWHGPSQGQIQPLQEVNAAAARVEKGFSTWAREAQEISGMDLDEIITEQTTERERLAAAGVPLENGSSDQQQNPQPAQESQPAQDPQPPSQTPRPTPTMR